MTPLRVILHHPVLTAAAWRKPWPREPDVWKATTTKAHLDGRDPFNLDGITFFLPLTTATTNVKMETQRRRPGRNKTRQAALVALCFIVDGFP